MSRKRARWVASDLIRHVRQFLNDLTDADVLIHVVDASGAADTEGNVVGCDDEANAAGSHPLNDLAWIRNELVEWVYQNLMFKWSNIQRRGHSKVKCTEKLRLYFRCRISEQWLTSL